MSVFSLPETEPAAVRIREAAARGTLSHALLLTGGADRLEVAQYAAAALECTAEDRKKPCGVCQACRKVAEGIHPDVMTVRDDQHKNLSVETVRAVRTDAYIRPNEGRRKVYLFPDCSLLTEQDQNILLKIVEEGPPYAAFLFCAENSAAVLQTLRSRCVELKLRPGQAQTAEMSEQAEALCRAIGQRRRGAVSEWAVRMERKKTAREELEPLLEYSREVVAAALLSLYGQAPVGPQAEQSAALANRLTKHQLIRIIELLQKYHDECAYNVGVNHVLGALAVELEGIL